VTSTPKISYSEDRRRPEKAASYNVKYEREFHKRLSNRTERRLIERLLARAGRVGRTLDVPCGAGRLSDVMARWTEQLYEADYAYPMLEYARSNAQSYTPEAINASAFELPFRDDAFDMVVSIRLSHHIPAREDRVRHLRELCRVSKRWVLVTVYDELGLRNRIARFRGRLRRRYKPKKTLSLSEVREAVSKQGFRPVEVGRISRLMSGHAFILMERL
jgi:2-polyprenyl-3-methyl-5-hydroxy-6-metoxy-1,4-benzoquinol methylase